MYQVRVELKNQTDDRDKDFKYLFTKFKRTVNESGLVQQQKQKESHETRGRKNRRKKKEADLVRLKAKENGKS